MPPRKGSKPPGKPRAGGFHVKTGCLTCKIRHVKCDEGKPECQKCVSTGRKCDGYTPAEKPSVKSSPENQLVNTSTQYTPDLISSSLSIWDGTLEELRGFDYFRVQTIEDLGYALNAPLDEVVLQVSHHHEGVKHAAIALGSLGEIIRGHGIVTWTDGTPASVRHEFARTQYYKAIQRLRQDINRSAPYSTEFALITCFLFVVFEFLQGNDHNSMTHLQSGLKIVRDSYFPGHDSLNFQARSCSQPEKTKTPIQESITRIFHILDMQANMWLGLRNYQSAPLVSLGSFNIPEAVPLSSFPNLDTASQALNSLITRIYHFRRSASKHDFAPSISHVPASVLAERDALLDELEVFRRSLNKFIRDSIEESHPQDPHRVTILRINRKVTSIMLATYLRPDEAELFAVCTPQFLQIVSLATFVLRPRSHSSSSSSSSSSPSSSSSSTAPPNSNTPSFSSLSIRPHPYPQCQTPKSEVVRAVVSNNFDLHTVHHHRQIFSFFAGLIQPLYYTAIKVRDRSTKEKAIELLEMEPWREGAWDSVAMARIARRKTEDLEAAGWYNVEDGECSGGGGGGIGGDGKRVGGRLSVDWTLATDPALTYPV